MSVFRPSLFLIRIIVFVLFFLISTTSASSQGVSLTTGAVYTQDFNTLSSTAASTTNNLTITGWFMTEQGGGARDNEQYTVDVGGSSTGDTYSYGAAASTDRALGSLRSGTLIPTFGAYFSNNTGRTIIALNISYTGEEWRLGTSSRTDGINFEYSTDASALNMGTWTGVADLNFVTPDVVTTGAKNGNAAADRTVISGTITGLSIANGAGVWIRWTDLDAMSVDDGLAVDDFSLQPVLSAAITFISGSTYVPSFPVPGMDNNVLGRVLLTGDNSNASLTSLTANISGTRSGITNLKLWSSTDETFDSGADQLLSTASDGGAVTFTTFSSTLSSSGIYYFITADLAADASGQVTGSITDGSSFTFLNGNLITTVNNDQLSQSSSVLPVELISFESHVEKNCVSLSWATATEVHNFGFEVERASVETTPGQDAWQKIGFVPGAGNSNSNKRYIHMDKAAVPGTNYYRLKQIDNDGKFRYSPVAKARVTVQEFSLGQNYPNPCNPEATISYLIPEDCHVSLKLYDITGREVIHMVNEFKTEGLYTVKFNGSTLSSGVYIYKLLAGRFSTVRKLSLLK